MNNYDFLKTYSVEYYLKYYPSKKRLREKLLQKSNNDKNLVENLFKDLDYLVDDNQVIEAKIKNYLSKNKNLNYIKSKLFEKGFQKEDYENILKNKFNLENSLLNEKLTRIKIENYLQKGKSKNFIFAKLCEREEDKEFLNSLLKEFDEEIEYKNLQKEYEKLEGKFEKNKIIEKLLRKGFSYGKVKKLFDC